MAATDTINNFFIGMVLAQAFKQAEKIETMKKDMALLAESTKSSDIDRFLKISQQLDIIRAAVDKSLKEIPPRYKNSDKKQAPEGACFIFRL